MTEKVFEDHCSMAEIDILDFDKGSPGPFELKHVDLYLDDMCDTCATYYCVHCPKHTNCEVKVIEECLHVPCLDCAVHKVRDTFRMAVPNTVGGLSERLVNAPKAP